MNTSHTPAPGPWTIQGKAVRSIDHGRYHTVARIETAGMSPSGIAGNSALIAAAPELLAALQQIDSNAAESVEWIRRVARAAITKALNEPA